jgi:KipI family sensor histidine kinase inhibitor
MRCLPLGDTAVLVELGAAPGPVTSQAVRRLVRALESDPLPGVVDIVPAYTTVTLHYDPLGVGGADPFARVGAWVERRGDSDGDIPSGEWREVVIPVRYGGESGPDLLRVAEAVGLTPVEVVRMHTEAVYTVEAIGFLPGFPYLSGLPRRLEVPRRVTPRPLVEAGSVAIAAAQAGIYPQASPGGWNVLGRTDVVLFDPHSIPPATLRVGDRVRFQSLAEDRTEGGGA